MTAPDVIAVAIPYVALMGLAGFALWTSHRINVALQRQVLELQRAKWTVEYKDVPAAAALAGTAAMADANAASPSPAVQTEQPESPEQVRRRLMYVG